MFGSNFFGQFGIPDFGYQGMDAQGGYLGNNDPTGQNNAQPPAPPAAAQSPLAAGPMAPGAAQMPQQSSAKPGM